MSSTYLVPLPGIKPRLRVERDAYGLLWWCSAPGLTEGCGSTPEEAYADFVSEVLPVMHERGVMTRLIELA